LPCSRPGFGTARVATVGRGVAAVLPGRLGPQTRALPKPAPTRQIPGRAARQAAQNTGLSVTDADRETAS
jgi:hypothetical protein